MITFVTSLFSIPSTLQLSALYSWYLAKIPIIIVGKTNTEFISRFSNIVIDNVKTEADLGFEGDAPIIKDMLIKAFPHIQTPMLGLINSDIIIRKDFNERLREIIERRGTDLFLTSVRYDIKYSGAISNDAEYDNVWKLNRIKHQDQSSDLFISSTKRFQDMTLVMPDFIMGRAAWDNWIHEYFSLKKIPCYNSSDIIQILHIEHGYDHMKTKFNDHPTVKYNVSLFKRSKYIHINDWPTP